METKELKITIPENQEIDWQKSAKQEKIVFKKKDTKLRSWKEYLKQYENINCYVLGYDVTSGHWNRPGIFGEGYCTLPSKELAEAFLAMMQLMSLRQAWIGDWDSTKLGNAIILDQEGNFMATFDKYHRSLTFPNRKMALDFMNTFKDLLEVAKPLI